MLKSQDRFSELSYCSLADFHRKISSNEKKNTQKEEHCEQENTLKETHSILYFHEWDKLLL